MDFIDYLTSVRPRVEKELDAGLPIPVSQRHLKEAEPTACNSVVADLNTYLYQPLRGFSATGGKRVRPALVLLATQAVHGNVEAALPVACAIEDFQSAALIHDDIADKSELRRGEPCLYRRLGTGLAINVGDAALVHTIGRICHSNTYDETTRLRLIDALISMQEHTLEGQALDLGWTQENRWDITPDEYLFMATSKTAYYSASYPLLCGAIVGGGTAEQRSALEAFGLKAGLAFQLQDDLLNLVGDAKTQGKDFRSDITEGKRTLLVVKAIEVLLADAKDNTGSNTKSSTSDAAVAKASYKKLISLLSSKTNDPILLEEAVELIVSTGAVDDVRAYAQTLIAEAKGYLEEAPFDAEARDTLLSMADFFVNRER
ncbi:polyprenyl synthetase family protein [Lancefieldella rimae]|uniref:polyprenyl synthetase family protein n=1 Tax=Lancefieldella rimae TaxID=1383 RepID=UPI001CABBC97|nr:polyprenyl synthetase family protein [Lancefieldella rimae]MBF4804937.1 polyprenyl synthetase family protein [Lancefieldella rimae]